VLSFSLEPMTADDLDEVLGIERASFKTPWSRKAFIYELKQNRVARCWVAREEGGDGDGGPRKKGRRVIGYVCVWEIGVEMHLTNLAVHPEGRRQGVGRALLGWVIEDARGRGLTLVCLEVRPTNVEALGLYESFGFRVVGRRKGYYFDTGDDALVMEASFAGVAQCTTPQGEKR
jgi:ribosomal-protein-alanine N-acetyltransferase